MAYAELKDNRNQWRPYYSSYYKKEKNSSNIADILEYCVIAFSFINICLMYFFIEFQDNLIFPYIILVLTTISLLFNYIAKNQRDKGELGRRTSFFIGFCEDKSLIKVAQFLEQGLKGEKKPDYNPSWYVPIPGIKGIEKSYAKDVIESIMWTSEALRTFIKIKMKIKAGIPIAICLIFLTIPLILFNSLNLNQIKVYVLLEFAIIPLLFTEIVENLTIFNSSKKIDQIERDFWEVLSRKNEKTMFMDCLRLYQEYNVELGKNSLDLEPFYKQIKARLDQEIPKKLGEIFS